MDLVQQRRFFAEEVEALANLKTGALVEALAAVPREEFLPPGPWMCKSETDFGGPPRLTPDADPRRVYHNVAVGIDPTRMLFNGAPGILSLLIDALALRPGHRVLHVGSGLGYYTALIASVVGSMGRVVAIEVDEALAVGARANLSGMPWVEVRLGNGTEPLDGPFDAILINAGVTHPEAVWLDALVTGGRLVMPITATAPSMGTIGKGVVVLATTTAGHQVCQARVITFIAIYSAVGLRDAALNTQIGQTLQRNPFPALKQLRRDVHDRSETCWIHGESFCFST